MPQAQGRVAAAFALLLAGCAGLPDGRFDGLGGRCRPASASAEAQAWFDQGLAFLYAFNHDEAVRSFERAAEIDPGCALAHWGAATARGPHINNADVEEDAARAGHRAAQRALGLASGAAPADRALIEAASKRFADPPPADRGPLDRAYAEAMREAWRRHPRDADVGALAAEALMDLHPWDLWEQDGGPRPWTGEILALLEAVLDVDPLHPLALHLYIHAVEGSRDPGKADAAADRLRDLAPGLGHLVHMPSHIDVRRGRWAEAIVANRKAIAADARYAARAHPPGFYRLYMSHNRHMLAFAAMMKGERRAAETAVREMIDALPADWLKEAAPLIDGYLASPYEVQVRFGRWQDVLAEPEPGESFPLARALWRQARSLSLAALGRHAEARAEQQTFLAAAARVPEGAVFGNNASADVLAVARAALEGELLAQEGKADPALEALRDAVRLEDALRYDEPPDWILPVRHALGAALLRFGRAGEAETVYREDLERWPENGWSLFGLARSLEARGKTAEAEAARARFARTWAGADVSLSSSCFCLPGERRP
jgi:tetratricopeptide (TPR) repeat protein